MNQTNKKIILISVLILTILACGLGGYTYAKYRTSIKGIGNVEVAKWSFKLNDNSEQIETIKLEDTVDKSLLINGKIAPGTSGQFTLIIDGTETEVGINYDIKFNNEKNKPTNLIFIYDGQTYNSLSKLNSILIGDIYADEENKTREITIKWEWAYETGTDGEKEANDKIDTQEGQNALTYTFDVVVTGTQIPLGE